MSSATWEIRKGDAMEVLATMARQHPSTAVVTSASILVTWGLRNYGVVTAPTGWSRR